MGDRKDKKSDKDPKALTWKERMDPDTAGKRWDDDVRKGFGTWKGKNG